jgi:hypothetical protein
MITLRWFYTSGNHYDYTSNDAYTIGRLYHLKYLEDDVKLVQVWFDGYKIIEWDRNKFLAGA